jgi:hypothetical protein
MLKECMFLLYCTQKVQEKNKMTQNKTRKIKNFVGGRKLSSSEELNYEGLQTLMSSLHPHTWASVSNSNLGDSKRNLRETTLMLEEHFKPMEFAQGYFDASHEVYSGKNERYDLHYVDVAVGRIKRDRCGYTGYNIGLKEESYKATLEFEVLKGGNE